MTFEELQARCDAFVERPMSPVAIQLPGHIYSDASQYLRDRIADWLEINSVEDDDFDSFYMDSRKDDKQGWSDMRFKYICYAFVDNRLALLFKLAFG